MLRKIPQRIFIFDGKWQIYLFRFRPLFAPERKCFSKTIPCGSPSWNGCLERQRFFHKKLEFNILADNFPRKDINFCPNVINVTIRIVTRNDFFVSIKNSLTYLL